MNSGSRLIVGLGNPGKRYENTWHNIGALAIEELARRWRIDLRPGKGEYVAAERITSTGKVMLMIPTSFMNRSGMPVAGWMRYYRILEEDSLIILDDHDLNFGRLRLRQQGSSGGHRGLEDIICRLNTDKIPRLRIGIKLDNEYPDLARQVLSKIPDSMQTEVDKVIKAAADAVEMVIKRDFRTAMNRFNGHNVLQ